MKEYVQELGNLGASDVAVITEKVIADVIEEIRRQKRVFSQFYKENRDLINTKGKEIVFPKKKAGITAAWGLSEGQGLSAGEMAYTGVTITVQKGGIGLGFTGEAIRQANRDVIADALKEAGEVWADTLDVVALEAMFPTVTVSATGASTVNLGTSIPIGVKGGSGLDRVEVRVESASKASVAFTGGATVTMWYIPTTNAGDEPVGAKRVTGVAGSFSARDILQARADITSKNFDPNVIIMHPDRLEEILYDPTVKFLEKSVYRGEGELYNGELGQLWGMKVIVTTKCPRYGIILLSSGDLGYEVWRKQLKLVRDDYTGMSADVLYFWGFGEVNYGVVNAGAYGAVAMKGTYTPTAN